MVSLIESAHSQGESKKYLCTSDLALLERWTGTIIIESISEFKRVTSFQYY